MYTVSYLVTVDKDSFFQMCPSTACRVCHHHLYIAARQRETTGDQRLRGGKSNPKPTNICQTWTYAR